MRFGLTSRTRRRQHVTARDGADGRPVAGMGSPALVSCLSARWTPTSAASRQDVPGQEGDDDNRRRDSDDGDSRSGYDHTAILASLLGVETRRRAELERGLRPGPADAPPPLLPTV